jgi:hypothetical protein
VTASAWLQRGDVISHSILTSSCDYIRPPRPERFARAMKQIFRPAEVLSHFVHYSTVTKRIARYYQDDPSGFQKSITSEYRDTFLDELTEGSLIHAVRSVPHSLWICFCAHNSTRAARKRFSPTKWRRGPRLVSVVPNFPVRLVWSVPPARRLWTSCTRRMCLSTTLVNIAIVGRI